MSKPKFFYCHGTAYTFGLDFDRALSLLLPAQTEPLPGNDVVVAGINGIQKAWNLAVPSDPFPDLLDRDLWDVVRVEYPAAALAMGLSIDIGAAAVMDKISELPDGYPFALGGYSQGAAVMSSVLREMQTGSLISKYGQFLGGVMFGNPRRKVNWRGPVGGTWSGAWDIPLSSTGGHGSFPTTGSWPRLTSPPDNWVDFAAPLDIFTAVGDSSVGLAWTAGNDTFLDLSQSQALTYFLSGMVGSILSAAEAAITLAGTENTLIDALGTVFRFPGAGHTVYAFQPPVNADGSAGSGDTGYQVALRFLSSLVNDWAVTPILVPDIIPSPGWQTTLAAPTATVGSGWSPTLV